jgi:hypothetical protein
MRSAWRTLCAFVLLAPLAICQSAGAFSIVFSACPLGCVPQGTYFVRSSMLFDAHFALALCFIPSASTPTQRPQLTAILDHQPLRLTARLRVLCGYQRSMRAHFCAGPVHNVQRWHRSMQNRIHRVRDFSSHVVFGAVNHTKHTCANHTTTDLGARLLSTDGVSTNVPAHTDPRSTVRSVRLCVAVQAPDRGSVHRV